MAKLPCNMDCFHCVHSDCINDETLTKAQECYYRNREKINKRQRERRKRKKMEQKQEE